MRVILKWPLARPGDTFYLDLPVGSRVVHAGLDGDASTDGMPHVWTEGGDPHGETEQILFTLVQTDEPYDGDKWRHAWTLNIQGYVFHLLRATG